MPSSESRSSSRIRPASMFVSPSRRRMVVLISRLPNVGSPPKPVPEMLVHRDVQRQRHVVVVMGARRDVDVHADVLVVVRRDRLLRRRRRPRAARKSSTAPARARRTVPARACLPRCEAADSRACACSVALEQPVVERRKVGEQDVGLREVAERAQVDVAIRVSGDGRRAVEPRLTPETRAAARIPAGACGRLPAARRR